MNPPSILLDHSFLLAVAEKGDANHGEATALYRSLLDDYVAQRCLLVARADHLAAFDNRELFAAVGKLHVARQHLSAAEKLRPDAADTEVDADLSITLVLLHRLRIRTVASFDTRLAHYEVTVLPPPNISAAGELDAPAPTELAQG